MKSNKSDLKLARHIRSGQPQKALRVNKSLNHFEMKHSDPILSFCATAIQYQRRLRHLYSHSAVFHYRRNEPASVCTEPPGKRTAPHTLDIPPCPKNPRERRSRDRTIETRTRNADDKSGIRTASLSNRPSNATAIGVCREKWRSSGSNDGSSSRENGVGIGSRKERRCTSDIR